MGYSWNRISLGGNLGAEPKVRTTKNGKKVATLSLATNRSYPEGEEWKTVAEWHRVVVWGFDAERIENTCTKGSKLAVEGRVQYRTWETDEGETKYITEIVAQHVLCPGHGEPPRTDGDDEADPFGGDDLPEDWGK